MSKREGQKIYPRNLEGILRMAVENSDTDQEDHHAASTVFSEMSKERREWLQEALSAIVEDTDVKRMMACIDVLEKTQTEDDHDPQDDLKAKESAFENLSMLVDNLDNANDFHKIGGFQVLLKYLHTEQSSLRWRAADLLAVCVQNNPYCQQAAMEMNVIPVLSTLLKTDPSEQVKVKALYAISCLTREYQVAEGAFLKDNGFSLLMTVMDEGNEKLVTKSLFMLQHILTANPSHKDALFNMGLIKKLVGLLHGPHKLYHEHIARLLVNFVTGFPCAVDECRRQELELKSILQTKISSLRKDESLVYEELILHCETLLQICFS